MAEYYVLETGSLGPFLPFLPPAQQEEAKRGALWVTGAVEGDTAIGAAAFALVGEVAHLVYAAVSPAWQKQGVATGMLWYFFASMPMLDCFDLYVSLSAGHPAEAAVTRIMEKLKARRETGAEQVSCPISALRESPLLCPLLGKESSRVVPMEEVSAIDLRELDARMLHDGAAAGHMDWQHFDPKLSYVGMDEHRQLNCCICTLRTEEGVSVEWIYAASGAGKTLIVAVLELLQACERALPADALFSAALVDDSARHLLQKLAGGAETVTTAYRWVLSL